MNRPRPRLRGLPDAGWGSAEQSGGCSRASGGVEARRARCAARGGCGGGDGRPRGRELRAVLVSDAARAREAEGRGCRRLASASASALRNQYPRCGWETNKTPPQFPRSILPPRRPRGSALEERSAVRCHAMIHASVTMPPASNPWSSAKPGEFELQRPDHGSEDHHHYPQGL